MTAALLATEIAGTGVTISSALTVAGLATSLVGGMRQSSAAQSAANTQAEIYNRQAARERQIGKLNAKRARARGERVAATQRALMGAGGQDLSSGSALLVQTDLASESEFNAKLAESNAEAAVSSKMSEAVLARAKGRSSAQSSLFRTGTALLKGVSTFG